MDNSLALVTGGGGAIGKAVAVLLASHGARVVVADLDLEAAQEVANNLTGGTEKHSAAAVDVSSSASVEKLAETVLSSHKGEAPKIVVHCAGIIGNLKGLFGGDEAEWDRTIDINLKGTYLVNRKFIRLMLDQNMSGCSIVNLASMAMQGFSIAPSYSASKGGVTSLTKAIAREFGPKGIRVNAVAPTFIENSMVEKADQEEEARQRMLGMTRQICPLKRLGTVEDVAELCYFLASDKSSFITGDVHFLSGGYFA